MKIIIPFCFSIFLLDGFDNAFLYFFTLENANGKPLTILNFILMQKLNTLNSLKTKWHYLGEKDKNNINIFLNGLKTFTVLVVQENEPSRQITMKFR